MIRMKVKDVSVDSGQNIMVLLVDDEESKVLPINVGGPEAQSILLSTEGVEVPRPMTHDLMKSVIEELGAEVKKVLITKIENGTYYAELCLKRDEEEIRIDARPSDAIALALRCDVPIYMKLHLVEFTYDLSDIRVI